MAQTPFEIKKALDKWKAYMAKGGPSKSEAAQWMEIIKGPWDSGALNRFFMQLVIQNKTEELRTYVAKYTAPMKKCNIRPYNECTTLQEFTLYIPFEGCIAWAAQSGNLEAVKILLNESNGLLHPDMARNTADGITPDSALATVATVADHLRLLKEYTDTETKYGNFEKTLDCEEALKPGFIQKLSELHNKISEKIFKGKGGRSKKRQSKQNKQKRTVGNLGAGAIESVASQAAVSSKPATSVSGAKLSAEAALPQSEVKKPTEVNEVESVAAEMDVVKREEAPVVTLPSKLDLTAKSALPKENLVHLSAVPAKPAEVAASAYREFNPGVAARGASHQGELDGWLRLASHFGFDFGYLGMKGKSQEVSARKGNFRAAKPAVVSKSFGVSRNLGVKGVNVGVEGVNDSEVVPREIRLMEGEAQIEGEGVPQVMAAQQPRLPAAEPAAPVNRESLSKVPSFAASPTASSARIQEGKDGGERDVLAAIALGAVEGKEAAVPMMTSARREGQSFHSDLDPYAQRFLPNFSYLSGFVQERRQDPSQHHLLLGYDSARNRQIVGGALPRAPGGSGTGGRSAVSPADGRARFL